MAARSKSSSRWLKEHFDDPYVKKAQRLGYRSRAVFKLVQLDEKYAFIKPGMRVLDLGAAPGGWSQYALEKVGDRGRVIASDILEIDPIQGLNFIQGDFCEDAIVEQILAALGEGGADLVISDMAPNMSGMSAVDQPRSMYLAELALDMAKQVLADGGVFLTKLFQGEGADALIKDLKQSFSSVVIRKPAASRPRSREVYALARDWKLV